MRNLATITDGDGNSVKVNVLPKGERRIEINFADGEFVVLDLTPDEARKLAEALSR